MQEECERLYEESVNALAEKYLRENPITEPFDEYVKKTFKMLMIWVYI